MFSCDAPAFDREALDRELRDALIADAHAVLHALCCHRCGSRDVALDALKLARWTEEEFVDELWAGVHRDSAL
jgi:hypothetical protein